jgi:hypothetical protein
MDLDSFLDAFFASLKEVLKSAHDLSVQQPKLSSGTRKDPALLAEEMQVCFGNETIKPLSFDSLFALLQATLRNSVNTNSPLFLNRLYSGAGRHLRLLRGERTQRDFFPFFFFLFFSSKKRACRYCRRVFGLRYQHICWCMGCVSCVFFDGTRGHQSVFVSCWL